MITPGVLLILPVIGIWLYAVLHPSNLDLLRSERRARNEIKWAEQCRRLKSK